VVASEAAAVGALLAGLLYVRTMTDGPGSNVAPAAGRGTSSAGHGPPMMLIAGVVSLVAVLLLGLFVVVLGDDDASPGADTPASTTTIAASSTGPLTTSTVPTFSLPTTGPVVTSAPTTAPTTAPTSAPTTAPTTAPATAAPTSAPSATAPPATAVPGPDGPAFARNPRFSLQVDDLGRPAPEVVAIADGATRICLTWDFFDVPIGIPLRMEWFINGEFSTAFDGVNDVGSLSGVYFACNFDPAGLPSGLHEIEWTADGTVVFRHGWYVGEGSIPIDIEFVNSTSGLELCNVNVSPQAATSFGIPLNLTSVRPGESFVVSVPDGVYDIQATACDGTIVTEEYGIDVLGPMTIPL
jgi:hypothetical protein